MERRLNIIYIVTDQQRWDALGCCGNAIVRTPHADALAAEGVRFTHAFTPTSICGPARASLFTGLYPSAHGVIGNTETAGASAPIDIRPGIAKLPDHLPGYQYFHYGKWHVEESRLPSDYGARGHDFAGYGYPGSGVYHNLRFNQPPANGNRYRDWLKEKGFAIPSVSEGFCGNNPNLQVQELRGKLSGPAEASISHFIVDEAISGLHSREDKASPFFLWMNFWGPHTPCLLPEPYYSMYDPRSIPEDPAFRETFVGKPLHHQHISQMWGVHDLDWAGWQQIIARYYGYITMIDDCLGRFVACLKSAGLYEESLIVFTSDHGDAMGAHRLIEKGEFMYDETYRVPLIARHPRLAKRGQTCDEFVYFHDLYPTAGDVATGRAPDLGEHSRSILPLMEGRPIVESRKFVFGEMTRQFIPFPQRMVRTRTHKLIFNAAAECELYDLENDPHELCNRFSDQACAGVKRELLQHLEGRLRALKDPVLGWFSRIRDAL